MEVRVCPKCGSPNKVNDKWCRACGATLPANTPVEVATVVERGRVSGRTPRYESTVSQRGIASRSDLEAIQCPNCGGYKVTAEDNRRELGCLILTGGLWFLVMIIRGLLGQNSRIAKPGDKFRCEICGYRWTYTG